MSVIPAFLICVLLAFAAWSDIRRRVLPNWTALAILVVALIGVAAGPGFGALPSHLVHFGLALLVGFALFAIKWIGGGDAKTYAALAMAVPISQSQLLLLYLCVAMLVVSLIWIVKSRISRLRERGKKSKDPSSRYAKIPVGVAIAAAGIAFLVPEVWKFFFPVSAIDQL